jgi:hypothetical protein
MFDTMNTTRFITPDEIDYLRVTYAVGRSSLGTVITEDSQEKFLSTTKQKMIEGLMHVAVVFDNDSKPIASYQAFEVPQLLAWRWNGLSSVANHNHYNKTAPIIAPALDMIVNLMESKGYYKFWSLNKESAHNIRYKIMCRHSTLLSRYNCYDELIIPAGKPSGMPLFDAYRPLAPYNLLVRLFSLDQTHRVEQLRKHGYEDYKGTLDI